MSLIYPISHQRKWMMLQAYLILAAKKLPEEVREAQCWFYLLIWASLGGKPDEVIGYDS